MKFLMNRLRSRPTVSVVRLSGVIASGGSFGSNTLNDAGLAPLLQRAFSKGKPKAVALAINSPGGSPVQSSLIGARIRRLSAEKDIPVFAFCEDVAASGGYWLASAADKIFVDPSSIVGSIGVISASFGFSEFIGKHGIERRVHTSGENKSLMDPFKPEKPEEVERLKALQKVIHQNFKDQITARRAGRLAERDLFTGEIWVGQGAIDVGLADAIGHLVPTMQDMFGDKVNLVVHGQKRSMFQRLGMGTASDVLSAVEDRSLWARYGL